jgi:hypothetical protein
MYTIGTIELTPSTKIIRDYLIAIYEVLSALQYIMPDNTVPQLVLLRSSELLKDCQACHVDNGSFYTKLQDGQRLNSFKDMSYSCFFGLEDHTYLGLAEFDAETLKLQKREVHIPRGSMLMISGNKIHYGIEYRGSSSDPTSFSVKIYPDLVDHIRCAAFIHPMNYSTDSTSQLWFADGQRPQRTPHTVFVS